MPFESLHIASDSSDEGEVYLPYQTAVAKKPNAYKQLLKDVNSTQRTIIHGHFKSKM